MPRNYASSTQESIGDVSAGMMVETSVLAAATYLTTGGIQTEIFNVYGRVKILQLFMEAITVFGGSAQSCTATNATNLFTDNAHGLSDTDRIMIGGDAVPTGIDNTAIYFVVNKAANTFQVSLTSGGAAVTFSDDGTNVTWSYATNMHFTFTSSTPVVAVQPMCGATANLIGLAQGLRAVWVGGAVATNAVITATAGISDVICVNPQTIGTADGVGTIGILTTVATMASGTCQFSVFYVPLDDGSYIEAAL